MSFQGWSSAAIAPSTSCTRFADCRRWRGCAKWDLRLLPAGITRNGSPLRSPTGGSKASWVKDGAVTDDVTEARLRIEAALAAAVPPHTATVVVDDGATIAYHR